MRLGVSAARDKRRIQKKLAQGQSIGRSGEIE
jgi:hypothetical protein